MFEDRTIITGTLHLLAPLHIGTGDTVFHPAVKSKKPGDNKPVQISAIMRDHARNPILPRSTLKGLLRRLGEEHEGADAQAIKILFGEIKDSNAEQEQDKDKPKGRMGRLLIHGGEQIKAGDASAYPYSDQRCMEDKITPTEQSPLCGEGVFIASQAAIDPALGVAADHKLYHSEMVAPGAQFQLKLVLAHRGKGDDGNDADDKSKKKKEEDQLAFDALMRILARLTHKDGVPCGSGQAEGAGRLKLDKKTLTITYQVVEQNDGSLTDKEDIRFSKERFDEAVEAAEKDAANTKLEDALFFASILTCEGPFLVVDSSHIPKKDDPSIPQLIAQRAGESGAPLMLPTGLAGVLRARSRWLEARMKLRADNKNDKMKSEAESKSERKKENADPIFPRKGEEEAKAFYQNTMTATERLFGINGFRGLLEITAFKITGGEEVPFTSVKLDSFSGAPIDNALFTTRAFVGAKLSFALRLKGRGKYQPNDEDTALFKSLKNDIEINGLMLGHGSAKGFGWFKVGG